MAADKLSYRYDRIEGNATVVKIPEERRIRRFLYAALAISCLVHILFIAKWFMSSEESHPLNISRSPYGKSESTELVSIYSQAYNPLAGLLNDVPVPFTWSSEYSDLNSPRLDELWQFGGTLDYGMVALTDAEVKSMSLLPSQQRFPWDLENKKMYVLNAYHGLHCLVSPVSVLPCC
jgi:hypothetical protein